MILPGTRKNAALTAEGTVSVIIVVTGQHRPEEELPLNADNFEAVGDDEDPDNASRRIGSSDRGICGDPISFNKPLSC